MIAESVVYKILANDKDLVALMDSIRGKPLNHVPIYIGTPDFNSATDYTIVSLTPWIRITLIPGEDTIYSDDTPMFSYPRVQVDFWVSKNGIDAYDKIKTKVNSIMHKNGWERYYSNAYIDSDTPNLRMVTGNYQNIVGLQSDLDS